MEKYLKINTVKHFDLIPSFILFIFKNFKRILLILFTNETFLYPTLKFWSKIKK